ncbi:MAG TPA: ABC transporter substrate-binding protein [Flavobacterium sp.]|nr:ABC transporter substrate-binding protein [Flavobacterium sp.]
MLQKDIYLSLFVSFLFLVGCKKTTQQTEDVVGVSNEIQYAKGFEIYDYTDFKILKITQPWPGATTSSTYVLANDVNNIPDSLADLTKIQIPIQRIVATSTTHIPSLVVLNEANSLQAFPGLDFISSEEVRALIAENKIKEIGDGVGLNFELTVDVSPEVVIANGGNDSYEKYQQIQQAGIPVIYNGDWVEYTPLGKAEWIKLFGVLYDKADEANAFFDKVVHEYNEAKSLVETVDNKPEVFSGAMFEDVWYAPQGDSWTSQIIADAGGEYLWADKSGTGSLSMAFEQVLDDAQQVEYWIGPAQFTSYVEMKNANIHYKEFEAFQNKKVYTYSAKKGATGGLIFYEEATNRPDELLKDYIRVLHPELLPEHELYFLTPLAD